MKKQFFLFLVLCVWSLGTWANVVTGVAAIPDGYYDGVDGKSSSDAVLDALFDKIKGHTIISYDDLEDYYEKTDFTGDTVWDMYSTCRFTMAEANKQQSKVCDGWNKEHSIPQSWFGKSSPMKSDLFHVYPTDARVNNFRSNNPYGEVAGENGAGFKDNFEGHGLGKLGSNTFPGYTGKVFEPADEFKGDFARTYFYMVARYRDKNLDSSEGSAVFTSNKTNLTEFAKNLFLKWHRQDPVSQKEIDRNEAVYGLQKNRNPFIDYPDLAEYIWGDKVGTKIDLASMTPTCEGGGSTPVDVTKYGVTWSVNGEELRVDSVVENKSVAMPDKPTSCSSESNVFMGWTNAPISGTTDVEPAVLYAAAAEFPKVTADVTYYAVFAQETKEGSAEPATYTFNSTSKDGWTCTAIWTSNTYWKLIQGNYIESPAVDLSGLSSITMNIRTYGGSGNATVSVKADGKEIATLTASNNKLNEYTWTNNGSLSGKSPLRFTADKSTSQGVGCSSITINATGAKVTYSRYITTCQSTMEVEKASAADNARKILVGGQLYILVGEQLFTITGQRVR